MVKAPFQRVLHVDDHKHIRGIVQLALGKIGGFTVLACGSGEEALAQAAAFGPELLLLDVNMPGMDGVELLRRLRAAGIGAPAVFFTGKVSPQDLANYRSIGAIGMVAKPFDPLRLSDQLIGFWHAQHAPKEKTA